MGSSQWPFEQSAGGSGPPTRRQVYLQAEEKERCTRMILEGVLIGVLWGWARRGTLRRLVSLPLRQPWWFLVGLLLQEGAILLRAQGWLPPWSVPVAVLLAHVCIIAGLVANRHLPGTGWLAAGTLLNLLVIAAHGGRMPVLDSAIRAAGLDGFRWMLTAGAASKYTLLPDGDPWAVLADSIPLYPPYYPLRRVASLGDIVGMVGMAEIVGLGMQGQGKRSQAPAGRVI